MALLGAACDCHGLDPDTVFRCSSSDDCVPGYVCVQDVCVSADAGRADAGAGDAGKSDGGDSDGGAPDGGSPDGGSPDGGSPDGGSPDGGAPDGGPSDSGVDAGLPNGTSCQSGAQCGSGFCTDAVCCASACTGPCESCSPGGGLCLQAPLRSFDPACYPYACGNGACAAGCVTAADCAPQLLCGQGGRCVPKVAMLRDDFDGGYFDAGLWSRYGTAGVSATIVNGVVEVTVGPLLLSQYAGVATTSRWDVTDSGVTLDLLGLGDRTPGLLMYFAVRLDAVNFYSFNVEGGGLYVDVRLDGGQSTGLYQSIPSTSVRRLKISESGGQLAFAFSDGGSTWARFFTTTPAFSVNEVIVDLGAGRYELSDGGITVVRFDNLNAP